MARGDSGKKVSRAARAGGKVRSAQQRSLLFPGFIAGVVVLGLVLIVLSLDSNDASSEPPVLGDHWHAAYGVYICDSFLPPLNDRSDVAIHNLHTHADGLIHIHPASSAATGENATLSFFADTVGMDLDSDSIDLPGDLPDVEEGEDDCDGEDAMVRLAVWSPTQFNNLGQATAWEDEPELILTDPAEFRPQDDQLVTIAFTPEDADIPQPPSIGALAAPADEPPPPGAPPPTDATSPTTDATSPTTDATSPTTDATSPTTDATSPTTDATSPTTTGE